MTTRRQRMRDSRLVALVLALLPTVTEAKDAEQRVWLRTRSDSARVQRVEAGMPSVRLPDGRTFRPTLEQLMALFQVPGVSVAVFDDFQVVWRKGYSVREHGSPRPSPSTRPSRPGPSASPRRPSPSSGSSSRGRCPSTRTSTPGSGFLSALVAFHERGQGLVIMTNSFNGSALFAPFAASMAREYGWQDFQTVGRSSAGHTLSASSGPIRFAVLAQQVGIDTAVAD